MIEIFWNEITLIFGLLAAFFVLMGISRHMIRKRNRLERKSRSRPCEISDPYAEPANAALENSVATQKNETLAPLSGEDPKRYFQEYGTKTAPKNVSDASPPGYVWE